MQLEDYFDFLAPDDIRIRGTRIGIESVLYEYIHRGQTPEAIASQFHTLTLDQVYATILYYLVRRDTVDKYLAEWLQSGRDARDAQRCQPQAIVQRLRQRKSSQMSAAAGT